MAFYVSKPKYIEAFCFAHNKEVVAEKNEVSEHIFHLSPDGRNFVQYKDKHFEIKEGDYAVVSPDGLGYLVSSKEEFEKNFDPCPV